jgi:predicted phage tail protein
MAEALSKREQICLEHVKQAQELGVSFAEFCRSFDLNVNTCYTIRRSLVRKGAIARRTKADEKEAVKELDPATPASFAQVRIAPPAAAAAVLCRIRHPSGWVIECASWPEGSWMAALFAAGEHAAT